MGMFLRKATLATVLAASVGIAAAPAEARDRYYRHRGGDDDAAIAIGAGLVGLAIGAAIASDRDYDDRYYYDRRYYYPRNRGYYYNGYPYYRNYPRYRYNYRYRDRDYYRYRDRDRYHRDRYRRHYYRY